MNPADEEAAKIVPTEWPSSGAVAGSIDKFAEQVRGSFDALVHPSAPPKPELNDLLSRITHHLDDEASERKAIHYRLLAIENEMKRRAPRGFARYLLAICIAVAATLAWQSYGNAAKQVIATNAPELGWSPGTKQMIAGWVQQLCWTKPPIGSEKQAAPVAQTAPETVVSKAPAVPSIDPAQVQQIARDLATLRQTVEQLAAGLDQVTRQIARLEAADVEILANITPAPPPPRSIAAAARKPAPVQPPSSRVPTAQPSSLAPMPPRQ